MEKTITLPLKDFKLIFEGFEAACDDYAGAKCVEETYMPIYNKYVDIIKEEKIMKYIVEITKRDVYVVEADAADEARELAINGCGELKIEDEIENIEVTNAEVRY